jgi:hypothetical protein
MQPPELYILEPPKLSPEEVEKLKSDTEKAGALVRQEVQNVKDLRHLPGGIRCAVKVNRSVARRLAKKDKRDSHQ